jgi:hypothetical protein
MAALFQVKQQVCPARNGHDRTGSSRKRLNGLAKGGRLFVFLPKVHRWCPSEKGGGTFRWDFPNAADVTHTQRPPNRWINILNLK